MPLHVIPLNVEDRVLGVPVIDVRVLPESRPYAVDGHKAPGPELGGPVFRPLLIHVRPPALPRNGCAEQDDGAVPHQGIDENVGELLFQMLGHLQADHEVERAAQVHGPVQVHLPKQRRRDQEPLGLLVKVHAYHVADALLDERPRPGAYAATYIHNAAAASKPDDVRHDALGRPDGARALTLVEDIVVLGGLTGGGRWFHVRRPLGIDGLGWT
jgi:hypothetical protein